MIISEDCHQHSYATTDANHWDCSAISKQATTFHTPVTVISVHFENSEATFKITWGLSVIVTRVTISQDFLTVLTFHSHHHHGGLLLENILQAHATGLR